MKKIAAICIFIMALAMVSGCSWYVRYPSVGVGVKVHPHPQRWKVVTDCKWVRVSPNKKVMRCKERRIRVR